MSRIKACETDYLNYTVGADSPMHHVGVGLFVLACVFSSGAKQNKVIHVSSLALCLCSLIVSAPWHRVNCGRAAQADPPLMSTRGQQRHMESSCPSCEIERVKKEKEKKKGEDISWDDEGAFQCHTQADYTFGEVFTNGKWPTNKIQTTPQCTKAENFSEISCELQIKTTKLRYRVSNNGNNYFSWILAVVNWNWQNGSRQNELIKVQVVFISLPWEKFGLGKRAMLLIPSNVKTHTINWQHKVQQASWKQT